MCLHWSRGISGWEVGQTLLLFLVAYDSKVQVHRPVLSIMILSNLQIYKRVDADFLRSKTNLLLWLPFSKRKEISLLILVRQGPPQLTWRGQK
jgi:hypothetical protein